MSKRVRLPATRRDRVAVLAGLTCVTQAAAAFAWGDDGQRIVGEIASHYLNPPALVAVDTALHEARCATLAQAATWADSHARRQLQKAGVRLAAILNQALGGEAARGH